MDQRTDREFPPSTDSVWTEIERFLNNAYAKKLPTLMLSMEQRGADLHLDTVSLSMTVEHCLQGAKAMLVLAQRSGQGILPADASDHPTAAKFDPLIAAIDALLLRKATH